MMKSYFYSLQSPKKEHSSPVVNEKRGENPQDEDGPFTGEAVEQEMILNDEDESSFKAMKKMAQNSSDGEDESEGGFHDPAGMVGPVHSHIEADNLSDEFLEGKVDLIQQMEKTVDAIHDAYEGELHDRAPRL